MAKDKDKKNDSKEEFRKPKVHPELEGFDVEIDSFGEIKTKFDIDKINKFLDKHVRDKKFRGIDVQRVEPDEQSGQEEE